MIDVANKVKSNNLNSPKNDGPYRSILLRYPVIVLKDIGPSVLLSPTPIVLNDLGPSDLLCFSPQSVWRLRLGGGAGDEETSGIWLKMAAVFIHTPLVLFLQTKKTAIHWNASAIFRGDSDYPNYVSPRNRFKRNPPFWFTTLYPSVVFKEVGPSDVLCFSSQWFLEKSAHLIYYVLALNHF